MSEYITLIGAEDVVRAGHAISSAASQMQSAANSISESVHQQQQHMDEWIIRFEEAISELQTKPTTRLERARRWLRLWWASRSG